MPEYKFDHIHLYSPAPVKTAEFYQKMFGATPVSSNSLGKGNSMINLNLGGVTLLISKTDDEKKFGLAHFGISTDNLNKAVDELKANGIKFTTEIKEIRPGVKISFLQAPESTPIELQEGHI